MKTVTLALLGSLVVLGVLVAPRARADEWNQEMILTFNTPVEIPGRVLSPGSYLFKVANTYNSHEIIEIFNANGTKLVETALSRPEYRTRATSNLVVTFEERAANAPSAVKTWFYPGRNWGHEFQYQTPSNKKS
jgi:hypothetical protein